MLLTIFAFGIGCAIGRLRGGSWAGVSSAQFKRPGLLVLGVTTVLVLNVIGPAAPLLWALVGTVAFFVFGFRNLQLTGMIVMLIGLLMNTAPLLANGAVPVSELAMVSVGDVDDNGRASIDGLRESTDTATTFAALGDVIPVPVVHSVVSIGDIVMLIALADITTNLFLRARRRDELDDAGVTFATDADGNADKARPAVLSPLSLGNRPAHAAHRRPRRKAAPSTHVPAHAKQSDFFDLSDPETVIVLDGADGYVESGATKTKVPDVAPPSEEIVPGKVQFPKTEIILPDVAPSPPAYTPQNAAGTRTAEQTEFAIEQQAKDVAAPTPQQAQQPAVVNRTELADRRPIIDLTVSPTDDQLQEFLRRRAEADAALRARTTPGPRRRRGRAPRRESEVADIAQ